MLCCWVKIKTSLILVTLPWSLCECRVAQYRQQMTFCCLYSIQQAAFLKCQVKRIMRRDQEALCGQYLGICYLHLLILKVKKSMACEALGIQLHYLQYACLFILGLQRLNALICKLRTNWKGELIVAQSDRLRGWP